MFNGYYHGLVLIIKLYESHSFPLIATSALLQYYTGCRCISDGMAAPGLCPRKCTASLVWYCILVSLFTVTSGMATVPAMTLFMRFTLF